MQHLTVNSEHIIYLYSEISSKSSYYALFTMRQNNNKNVFNFIQLFCHIYPILFLHISQFYDGIFSDMWFLKLPMVSHSFSGPQVTVFVLLQWSVILRNCFNILGENSQYARENYVRKYKLCQQVCKHGGVLSYRGILTLITPYYSPQPPHILITSVNIIFAGIEGKGVGNITNKYRGTPY